MRVTNHPILGSQQGSSMVTIYLDGDPVPAREGEPIAAALIAAGRLRLRYTVKRHEPRGVFCGIGRCTDCVMTVNGEPNVRTCVTPVTPGMNIVSQGKGSTEAAQCKG